MNHAFLGVRTRWVPRRTVDLPVFRYVWLMGQPGGDPPFGRYLRSAIADAEFRSPTAFARAAGVEPSVVLRWINGKAQPSTRTLAAVAPVLQVSAADLVRAAYPDEVTEDRPEPSPRFTQTEPSDRFRRRPPDAAIDDVLIEGSGGSPKPEPRDIAAELMTASGVHANLYAAKIELTDLIHGSGLGPEDRYQLIREHRLAQQEFDEREAERIAARIEAMRRKTGS